MEPEFVESCQGLRASIMACDEGVKSLKGHHVFQQDAKPDEDRGEMIANIMLAHRHLEDARMRLGKAIQAFDGGTSVYDK